jgi:DNA-directed RNA polymerase subunit RPC12/RpoP
MAAKCANCGESLDEEWMTCPYCGKRVMGRSNAAAREMTVQIVSKVISGLIEAGLLQAEAKAREKGRDTQAEQIVIARNIAKDLAPLISEAIVEHGYNWMEERRRKAKAGGGLLKGGLLRKNKGGDDEDEA